MIAVVVEPTLLAVPPIAQSEEEVEAIIDRLTTWSKYALNKSVLKVAQLTQTAEVLWQTNCFPSGPNVLSLLQLYGLDQVYTPSEVTRLINTIIERAILVSSVTGFEVEACNTQDVQTELFQAPELAAASACAFATLAAGIHADGLFLAAANAQDSQPLRFRGEVTQVAQEPGSQLLINVPFSVDGVVQIARGLSCVCDATAAHSIWNQAQDNSDIHSAVSLKVREILKLSGHEIEITKLPSFSIGSEFFRSLGGCQAGPNSRFGNTVLDSCARVVMGAPKNSVDPFTKGPRSKAKEQRKRKRDAAHAFRTHITKSAEGLRLAFWKAPDGTIEFANLAVHDDLSLEEGDASKVVTGSW